MEKDKIAVCPYCNSHQVRQSRMSYHLVKCGKHHKSMSTCPLNATHKLAHCNMPEHVLTCPDLTSMVRNEHVGEENLSIEQISLPNPEENWDEEPEASVSYDPMANLENRNILRCVIGLSKAERKKFKKAERARLANLEGISTGTLPLPKTSATAHEQPVRAPHTNTQVSSNKSKTGQTDSINKGKHKLNENKQDKPTVPNESNSGFYKTSNKTACSSGSNTETKNKPDHDQKGKDGKTENSGKSKNDVLKQLKNYLYSNGRSINKPLRTPQLPANKHSEFSSRRKENFDRDQIVEHTATRRNVVTEVDAPCDIFGNNAHKISIHDRYRKERDDKKPDGCGVKSDKLNIDPAIKETGFIKEQDKIKHIEDLDLTWNQIINKLNDKLLNLKDIQDNATQATTEIVEQCNNFKLFMQIEDNDSFSQISDSNN